MNMMLILAIVLGVLAVGEIIIAIMLISWRMDINEEAEAMKHFTDMVVKLWSDTRDYEKKMSDRMIVFADTLDHHNTIYKEFVDVAQHIVDEYKRIVDGHHKLLDCWRTCEERYSASYEQFIRCSDQLEELNKVFTRCTDQLEELNKAEYLQPLASETEYDLTLDEACDTICLDCAYVPCRREDCPVYKIMHRDDTTNKLGNDKNVNSLWDAMPTTALNETPKVTYDTQKGPDE